MTWTVETANAAVDAELEELPIKLRARLLRLLELIEARGLMVMREPHAKHLDGKLWELRAKSDEGIARAIYVAVTGRRVVILHAFVKKTAKTPAAALSIARQRLKELGQ
ncbi:MAG: type II toxin-antitoxin system RelE/ParE family toxin [Gammaproteobacteria bacterium]|nr:MAG: type II toxin-antitoxin system RelE/ParE family toxin [Gammaproteobacteria bacterium]